MKAQLGSRRMSEELGRRENTPEWNRALADLHRGYDYRMDGVVNTRNISLFKSGGKLQTETKSHTNSTTVIPSQYPLSTSSTAASSPMGVASNVTSSCSPPPLVSARSASSASSSLLAPPGVFREDSPPSPGLTKSLLALAQQRKKGGQHSLGSDKKLHLSPSLSHSSSFVDRVGIPDDLYESLLSSASIAKKSGRHTLQRRRSGGLAGESVHTVLVSTSCGNDYGRLGRKQFSGSSVYNMDTMPVLSPSLF